MRFKLGTSLIACVLALMLPQVAQAQEPNNKFGIHIVDENDLDEAAALVNGGGGQWGYLTFVIREDERDVNRWQQAFDKMRRLKLIPIVRLATKQTNSSWEIPKKEEAVNWAGFLNSLNWPIKSRYVILFNEPNHASEWGGKLDPAEYAKTYRIYYETLKEFSPDFFVLPAALDLAASSTTSTMNPESYYLGMQEEDNFIFTLYDGLNSHSYPNPGFSGSATDTGKKSINGYIWETNYLADFGLDPGIPVFITETGWVNSAGNLEEKYKYAYENVWTDQRIIAVTPFLLNYLDSPFAEFSWKDPATKKFLPQYYSVQSITKVKGKPEQVTSFQPAGHSIADYLISDSEYSFIIKLKNTGQSIWNYVDGFSVVAESTMKDKNIKIGKLENVEPGHTADVGIRLSTDEPRGIHSIKLFLYKDDKNLGEISSTNFTLVSPPSLDIFARFTLGDTFSTASLSLYEDGVLVTRYDNLAFADGHAVIPAVRNVVPNKNYEFKLSRPFLVAAIRGASLYVGRNQLSFGRLLPIDFSGDTKLDMEDLLAYFKNPLIAGMRIFSIK